MLGNKHVSLKFLIVALSICIVVFATSVLITAILTLAMRPAPANQSEELPISTGNEIFRPLMSDSNQNFDHTTEHGKGANCEHVSNHFEIAHR